jgi:queuine/archaeosine tRNA-ribosyltransferase
MFTSAGYLKVDRSSLDGSMEKIPVAPGLQTSVSENYTLGYLRHLLHADELLGCAREAIQKNSYEAFRRNFWQLYVLS